MTHTVKDIDFATNVCICSCHVRTSATPEAFREHRRQAIRQESPCPRGHSGQWFLSGTRTNCRGCIHEDKGRRAGVAA